MFIRFFLPLSAVLLVSSCNSDPATASTSPASVPATYEPTVRDTTLTGFRVTPVAESSLTLAEKFSTDENLVAQGTLKNGLKQGSWAYYEAGAYRPVRTESYVDGKLTGAQIHFDPYGRLVRSSFYLNGQLHGPYAEYRAGIPQVTATYRNGKLHGTFRSHTLQNGKVNRTVEYVDGIEEGPMRWYNEAGELIQERLYHNGKLVD